MELSQKERISNTVWAAKAISILSVIVAHTNYSFISDAVVRMVLARIGAIAVPLFLMLAGYYFHTQRYQSLWQLLKNKAIHLGLPWLFCGSLVYLYSTIRAGDSITISNMAAFLFGYNSYLYFLSVLLVLQVIFLLLKRLNRVKLACICLVISGISVMVAAMGISDPVLKKIGLTHYLNLLNWCGFFALGFAAQIMKEERIIVFLKKAAIPSLIIWFVLFVLGFFVENGTYGYISYFGFFMELCSCFFLLQVGIVLGRYPPLVQLGKYSFTIYLLHIQVIPIVAKFLGGQIATILLSPLVTYMLTFGAIWMLLKIATMLQVRKMVACILGMRI